jgi:hypothetical protein
MQAQSIVVDEHSERTEIGPEDDVPGGEAGRHAERMKVVEDGDGFFGRADQEFLVGGRLIFDDLDAWGELRRGSRDAQGQAQGGAATARIGRPL